MPVYPPRSRALLWTHAVSDGEWMALNPSDFKQGSTVAAWKTHTANTNNYSNILTPLSSPTSLFAFSNMAVCEAAVGIQPHRGTSSFCTFSETNKQPTKEKEKVGTREDAPLFFISSFLPCFLLRCWSPLATYLPASRDVIDPLVDATT